MPAPTPIQGTTPINTPESTPTSISVEAGPSIDTSSSTQTSEPITSTESDTASVSSSSSDSSESIESTTPTTSPTTSADTIPSTSATPEVTSQSQILVQIRAFFTPYIIIAFAVGGTAFILLITSLCLLCRRKRKQGRAILAAYESPEHKPYEPVIIASKRSSSKKHSMSMKRSGSSSTMTSSPGSSVPDLPIHPAGPLGVKNESYSSYQDIDDFFGKGSNGGSNTAAPQGYPQYPRESLSPGISPTSPKHSLPTNQFYSPPAYPAETPRGRRVHRPVTYTPEYRQRPRTQSAATTYQPQDPRRLTHAQRSATAPFDQKWQTAAEVLALPVQQQPPGRNITDMTQVPPVPLPPCAMVGGHAFPAPSRSAEESVLSTPKQG